MDAGFLMTTTFSDHQDSPSVNTCGLYNGQSAAVLAAFELTDAAAKVWKMLLLRKTDKVWSYGGDWSQTDARWTAALKA